MGIDLYRVIGLTSRQVLCRWCLFFILSSSNLASGKVPEDSSLLKRSAVAFFCCSFSCSFSCSCSCSCSCRLLAPLNLSLCFHCERSNLTRVTARHALAAWDFWDLLFLAPLTLVILFDLAGSKFEEHRAFAALPSAAALLSATACC